MKTFDEIINNSKLTIKTQLQTEDGDVQIRAYYNDPVSRKRYWCKFTKAQGWEHVTVAGVNHKVPDWDIMCKVKDIFWNEEECCIEYHPRKSQYINNNEYCLHIWRPLGVELPEPPTILLGLQDIDSNQTEQATEAFLESLTPEERLELAQKLGINIGNRSLRRGGTF